jgi:hypothetical protein
MLIMGWDGTEVTPQIRNLIENHHLGSILLTAKNLKCLLRRVSLISSSPHSRSLAYSRVFHVSLPTDLPASLEFGAAT